MSTCPHCWRPSLETKSISHGMPQRHCQFCDITHEIEAQQAFDVITPDACSDELEKDLRLRALSKERASAIRAIRYHHVRYPDQGVDAYYLSNEGENPVNCTVAVQAEED